MPRPANPEVRHRLIEAGRSLFLNRGFNASGVQELVEAAGIPKGSFYSYFGSKEEFALEVLEQYWTDIEERFGGILQDVRLTPTDRILRYFKSLSAEKAKDNYATGCLIGNLSLEIANLSPKVRSKLSDIFERWEAPIVTCLREAQERHEITPRSNLRDLAAAMIESWEGAAMRAKIEQKRRPYRHFEEVILTNLLRA
ncbi:MAG TPA: TetR family transcriptional regulator C-terminal domain-containing protein [Chthoniobacterales bacterium]|jgi:TetR/AcrR family transcriptional regulator, transcriptional repressor for nem operon|nr:TetR family transcriptional regulator C-terminal domain-containing protein [Chthoniobacterales bacterium]